MEEKQNINIHSGEGNEFSADSIIVVHKPSKLFLDFSSTTPRIEKGGILRLIVKHNVAIVDPYLAKEFSNALQENIKKYEEKFGEIKKPIELEKVEKEAKKQGKKSKILPESYFG